MKRREILKGIAATTISAAVARAAHATWPYHPGGAFNSDLNVNTEWFNVVSFGAIGDGASHLASDTYGSLAALQVAYPQATALTNEINWLAFQAAINAADKAGGGTVFVPYGTFVMVNANSALDGSGSLRIGESLLPGFGNAVNMLGCGGRNGPATTLSWPNDLGQPPDATFTGAISGTTLTVSGTVSHPIIPGMYLASTSVTAHTRILNQLTGTANGTGTYTVSLSQTFAGEAMTGSFAVAGNLFGRRAAIMIGQTDNIFTQKYTYLQDFFLNGPGVGNTIGVSDSSMLGLQTCDRVALLRFGAQRFFAGVNLTGGQTSWTECWFERNFYGCYIQNQTAQFGDMVWERCSFSLNNMAGVGCSPIYGLPSTALIKCIFDAQPYGFYKEPWTPAAIAALGAPTTSNNAGMLLYNCKLIECQFENIGNAAFGESLFTVGVFTGSISGTTLTTTGSPALQVGHQIIQAPGGGAIASNTFVTAILGANSFTVSVSQTVASTSMQPVRSSFIYESTLSMTQLGWWISGGAGSGVVLAGAPATGLFQIANATGLSIDEPSISFMWAPGADSIFDIASMASGAGGYNSPIGINIRGDVSTLITNCITGSLGGHGFFSNATFISPGYVQIENYGAWKGEATYTFGFQSVPLGSVINSSISPASPALSAGNPQDNVQGILVFQGQWGIVAKSGIVNVASGANSITAGQWVRTAASGVVTAATRKTDTTSVVIGYALSNSSGGFTTVRLIGLE